MISNGVVPSKIYDNAMTLNFDIVNCPFFDGDVPCRPFYEVYISHLIKFASVCGHI